MLFLKVLQQMAVVVAWGILGDAQDAGQCQPEAAPARPLLTLDQGRVAPQVA